MIRKPYSLVELPIQVCWQGDTLDCVKLKFVRAISLTSGSNGFSRSGLV